MWTFSKKKTCSENFTSWKDKLGKEEAHQTNYLLKFTRRPPTFQLYLLTRQTLCSWSCTMNILEHCWSQKVKEVFFDRGWHVCLFKSFPASPALPYSGTAADELSQDQGSRRMNQNEVVQLVPLCQTLATYPTEKGKYEQNVWECRRNWKMK